MKHYIPLKRPASQICILNQKEQMKEYVYNKLRLERKDKLYKTTSVQNFNEPYNPVERYSLDEDVLTETALSPRFERLIDHRMKEIGDDNYRFHMYNKETADYLNHIGFILPAPNGYFSKSDQKKIYGMNAKYIDERYCHLFEDEWVKEEGKLQNIPYYRKSGYTDIQKKYALSVYNFYHTRNNQFNEYLTEIREHYENER